MLVSLCCINIKGILLFTLHSISTQEKRKVSLILRERVTRETGILFGVHALVGVDEATFQCGAKFVFLLLFFFVCVDKQGETIL